jgi:hypothetical protein
VIEVEVNRWGEKMLKNICGEKKVALNQAGEIDASLRWVCRGSGNKGMELTILTEAIPPSHPQSTLQDAAAYQSKIYPCHCYKSQQSGVLSLPPPDTPHTTINRLNFVG